MKIAFIGQKGIPVKIGGVERYVDEIATRLAESGHEVTVYVRNYYTPKRLKHYNGVKLVHIPTLKTKHLDAITHTFLSTLHALFQKYDVIHYQAIGPSSLCVLTKIFSRKAAIISTHHSRDYYHAKWNWFAKLFLRLSEYISFRFPDKTIAVGKDIAELGKTYYNSNPIYIPNGVTLFKKAGSLNLFKKWNLKRGKYFLTVSRLVPHKEIHTLIKAFASLKMMKKIDTDWKLVIAGGGSYTDSYVKELKAMSRGRKDVILAGVQKGEKLAALLKNAYAFVQPSRAEGLSIALLEAMGMGLAPLVSDIPENLSAIQGNGFIFRTGDVFDLMNKIEYLINNPAKVRKIGKRAREIVKEYYNWDIIVGEIEAVYSEALDEKISEKFQQEVNFARKTRII